MSVDYVEIRKPVGPIDPRLGRIQRTDSRSVQWVHDVFTKEKAPTYTTQSWLPKVGILDQSNLLDQGIYTSELVLGVNANLPALGSCTGNASTYAASSLLELKELRAAGYDCSTPKRGEETAIQFYSQFTFEDDILSANWPSVDCGSSGLGACRVMKKLNLIGSYMHATNADSAVDLMQTGGVIVGMPWLNSFFEPDKNGFIDADPKWEDSGDAGGHEIYWSVLEKVVQTATGKVEADKTIIAFPNSWNLTWGDTGWGRMYLSTYNKLRFGTDIQQFRR